MGISPRFQTKFNVTKSLLEPFFGLGSHQLKESKLWGTLPSWEEQCVLHDQFFPFLKKKSCMKPCMESSIKFHVKTMMITRLNLGQKMRCYYKVYLYIQTYFNGTFSALVVSIPISSHWMWVFFVATLWTVMYVHVHSTSLYNVPFNSVFIF